MDEAKGRYMQGRGCKSESECLWVDVTRTRSGDALCR